jgi:hypothetical protein
LPEVRNKNALLTFKISFPKEKKRAKTTGMEWLNYQQKAKAKAIKI